MKEHSMVEGTVRAATATMSDYQNAGSSLETRIERAARAYRLTRRQAEVLLHLSEGRANKEIANALACAEVTVEAHMTQLLRKVGVGSRGQLISRFWSSF